MFDVLLFALDTIDDVSASFRGKERNFRSVGQIAGQAAPISLSSCVSGERAKQRLQVQLSLALELKQGHLTYFSLNTKGISKSTNTYVIHSI